MKELEKVILMELKQERKNNQAILNELVREKIKNTESNKFNLKEIKYWSDFFKISMTSFVLDVLRVDIVDYEKLLKNTITKISSNEFNKVKDKIIRQKKSKYYSSKNLNRKIYYNRCKIFKESAKLEINIIDFDIRILGKNRQCLRRVMKDAQAKTRLSIGSYVNAKLPKEFVEYNYIDIERMAISTINKASKILCVRLKMEDKQDIIQDSICYIIENGNILDKCNKPIIQGAVTTKRQKRRMYVQQYYYAMKQIKLYAKSNAEYNDCIKYSEYQVEDTCNDVYEYIDTTFDDELIKNIFKMIYQYGMGDNTKQKIMKRFKLDNYRLEKIITENVAKLKIQNDINVNC